MTAPFYPYDPVPEPYEPYMRSLYGGLNDVQDDDITQGFTVYLLDQAAVLEAVGKEPGTEVPFIFQEHLLKTIEGTQSNAIVVTYMGEWASRNLSRTGGTHGSFESVRMSIRIYCDPMRDEGGNATPGADRETRLRVLKINRILSDLLDNTYGEIRMGDVRVIDLTRLGTIAIAPEPQGDGVLRGEVFYGVSILGYYTPGYVVPSVSE